MKKYKISYWEQESVWVRRTIQVKCKEKPTSKHIKTMIKTDQINYIHSDYNLETTEHLKYDFDTDFEVEEVKWYFLKRNINFT